MVLRLVMCNSVGQGTAGNERKEGLLGQRGWVSLSLHLQIRDLPQIQRPTISPLPRQKLRARFCDCDTQH
jgi:hypothetical protein